MTITKKDILWLLSPFLIAVYPALNMHLNNIGEAFIKDTILTIVTFISIVIILLLLYYFILKNIYKAVFLSNISLLFIIQFKNIEDICISIYSGFYYWHIVLIVLFIIINLVILFKQYNFKECKNINTLISIVLVLLLSASFIQAIPDIFKYSKKENNSQNQIKVANQKNNLNINFYYFMFDEYGGYQNMKYFFNYIDPLYENISNLKVNIGYNSYNKAYFTVQVFPDLMNLKYMTDENTKKIDAINMLKNPTIYQICKNAGYNINLIQDGSLLGIESADYVFKGHVSSSDTIFNWVIKSSVFYPLITKLNSNNKIIQTKLDILDVFAESYKIGNEPKCTIGYIGLPHPLFYFDENGNLLDGSENMKFDDKNYLGQFKYTSKRLGEIIENIIKNDPNSVILVQSDHGSRMVYHRNKYNKDRSPSEQEYHEMKSILNVLYYQGETINIDNLSGYETLNYVMKRLFQYEGGYE